MCCVLAKGLKCESGEFFHLYCIFALFLCQQYLSKPLSLPLHLANFSSKGLKDFLLSPSQMLNPFWPQSLRLFMWLYHQTPNIFLSSRGCDLLLRPLQCAVHSGKWNIFTLKKGQDKYQLSKYWLLIILEKNALE